MKKLKSLGKDTFKGGKIAQERERPSNESGELPPFKGTRAGAMRKGNPKIMIGYPDSPKEGNGHPGVWHKQ